MSAARRDNPLRPIGEILGTVAPWLDAAVAANGMRVHDNFAAWFGSSRVKDIDGGPLVVFHGTRAGDFDQFRPNIRPGEQVGFGIHFAESAHFARRYASDVKVARLGSSPKVYAVALHAERPLFADRVVRAGEPDFALARELAGNRLFRMTQKDEAGVDCVYLQNAIDCASPQRAQRAIEAAGYDAVRYQSRIGMPGAAGWSRGRTRAAGEVNTATSWIVFRPDQIKSVTDNSGLFLRGPLLRDEFSTPALVAILRHQADDLVVAIRARAKADRAAGLEQIRDETLLLNRLDSERVTTLMGAVERLIRPPPSVVTAPELADVPWFSDATPQQQAVLEQFECSPGGLNGLAYRAASEDVHESAQASFVDYETVPGIREVPMATLGDLLPGYDDPNEMRRIEALAAAIRDSGEIEPIFVGIDPTGQAYVMEGQHRVRALIQQEQAGERQR
jgi:hypothetical protein